MTLPTAVRFEGDGPFKYYYRKVGFRPPKKGEFYLSGAVVQAYRAPNYLSASYLVVEKTTLAWKMVPA